MVKSLILILWCCTWTIIASDCPFGESQWNDLSRKERQTLLETSSLAIVDSLCFFSGVQRALEEESHDKVYDFIERGIQTRNNFSFELLELLVTHYRNNRSHLKDYYPLWVKIHGDLLSTRKWYETAQTGLFLRIGASRQEAAHRLYQAVYASAACTGTIETSLIEYITLLTDDNEYIILQDYYSLWKMAYGTLSDNLKTYHRRESQENTERLYKGILVYTVVYKEFPLEVLKSLLGNFKKQDKNHLYSFLSLWTRTHRSISFFAHEYRRKGKPHYADTVIQHLSKVREFSINELTSWIQLKSIIGDFEGIAELYGTLYTRIEEMERKVLLPLLNHIESNRENEKVRKYIETSMEPFIRSLTEYHLFKIIYKSNPLVNIVGSEKKLSQLYDKIIVSHKDLSKDIHSFYIAHQLYQRNTEYLFPLVNEIDSEQKRITFNESIQRSLQKKNLLGQPFVRDQLYRITEHSQQYYLTDQYIHDYEISSDRRKYLLLKYGTIRYNGVLYDEAVPPLKEAYTLYTDESYKQRIALILFKISRAQYNSKEASYWLTRAGQSADLYKEEALLAFHDLHNYTQADSVLKLLPKGFSKDTMKLRHYIMTDEMTKGNSYIQTLEKNNTYSPEELRTLLYWKCRFALFEGNSEKVSALTKQIGKLRPPLTWGYYSDFIKIRHCLAAFQKEKESFSYIGKAFKEHFTGKVEMTIPETLSLNAKIYIYTLIIDSYIKRQNYHKASSTLNTVNSLVKTSAQLKLYKGVIAMRQGNRSEAQQIFEDILLDYPNESASENARIYLLELDNKS